VLVTWHQKDDPAVGGRKPQTIVRVVPGPRVEKPKKQRSSHVASEATIMKSQNYSTTFIVDETPEEAFAAINNVRDWWSGNIEGSTNKLGDEWTYRYKDIHYSKQKITEFIPGKKVVWLVLDSYLNFIEDKTEWNGTKITFEIGKKGDKTEVRFDHLGLTPEVECYDACSNAWGGYVNSSLRNLITKGKGQPNRKEQIAAKKKTVKAKPIGKKNRKK
jgi:hypothetical protein